ncbi:Unknown protein [Striga hermonthica]|uniref:Uncharacterized protein n=1 Tax=Striga hermonthica TaxID=68872 RepID=A0A9N7P5P7_STRHE|nr:Unknown protein [Striga hermonthica]
MDLSSSSSESDHQFRTNGNGKENRFRRPFEIVATTLLSLLLPLSFLLLGRLSTARYLLSASDTYLLSSSDDSFLRSFFLSHAKNPTILHLLVSVVSVSALVHALTDKIGPGSGGGRNAHRRRPLRLWAAWIFLCAAQVCVGMGIEGSIAAGVDGSGFGRGNGAVCRAVFFVGMHETAVWWWRVAVKPVVDDTVFGRRREEGWGDRAAVAAGCGWVWWWRVREEVESLVVVAEVRRELMIGTGAADIMGWWLYYLTVTVGMVRVVRGILCAVVFATRRREGGEAGRTNDDKV